MDNNFTFALYADSLYAQVAIVTGSYYSVSDFSLEVSVDQVKQTLKMCGQAHLDSQGINTSNYDYIFDIRNIAEMSTEQISLFIAGSAVKSLNVKVFNIETHWAATTVLCNVDYDD